MTDALGIDFKFLLIQALGFALLMLILSKFAFGPILRLLQNRQDTIRGNFDEAEARRNEMIKLQRDYEERLAKIEDEARDKIQVAVREAQVARDEIVARAQSEAENVIARGRADLQMQQAQAIVTMRDQLADLAVQAASRVVKQNLNTASHAQLIDEAIANLGTIGGASAGAGAGAATQNGASTRGGLA